ncbi:ATP-binding protein [Pseudomonas frederiksbergensis]|uniref:ATP-binding protein n=1 Tax=Pseudomonas frederiksbergensis TaxID=104087 RepID=UPI00197DADD2|nr:ATP-binding protein [Pseudomonas frederiksbergensis]
MNRGIPNLHVAQHLEHCHIQVSLDQDDGLLRIQVRDNGQGIPVKELPRIFELLGQVNDERQRTHKSGLGIGLALVRELVEAQQGGIEHHRLCEDRAPCSASGCRSIGSSTCPWILSRNLPARSKVPVCCWWTIRRISE